MVRKRIYRAFWALGLLLYAVALKADEIREEELGGPGDAFSQAERLSDWARQVERSQGRSPKASPPPAQDFMIDFDGRPVEVKPLAPDHSFNPRTLGGFAKAEPKKDGVVGAPKLKFGDRKDVSLATIAQNNQAAAEAIAQAAAPDTGFVMPSAYFGDEMPREKSFEERLEILSQKESPFSLQDYVEFRDFVADNEEKVTALPNKDSRFHNNLKQVYDRYINTDANRASALPLKRFFGAEPNAKDDTSKKRSGLGGRTH